MEVTNQEVGEVGLRVPVDDEPAALDIIRTETVLSRLPIHNLAKKGNVNIQIIKTTPDGKVELKWIVSYSDRYGQARQLAYKLDTIVINHHIDEQGRPLPKMICLGSLRDVADQLDLGGDTNKVRRALRQNASAFITAKFEYRGNDGSKKTLEADFTRYSVVFTGEQLPDGRRADAVYIILNEPYREVLNNAPVRPLDRAYMKELPPAAQRFYEIISYKVFSALKNNYPHAKISYSEYCTFSAQLRHYERQPVQDQMAKVLRPHKESGYITAVKYEPTIDAENKLDWIMYLTPGPKAYAEFAVAHGRRVPRKIAAAIEAGDEAKRRKFAPRESAQHFEPPSAQTFDPNLVTEFTRRGITETKTRQILANLKPGQDVLAQLELIDQLVQKSRVPIENPPGFYIRLIESNTAIPENFETTAKRKAREERELQEREQRAAEDARQLLEWDYEDYCVKETERHIEENPAAFESIQQAKRDENHERHPSFSVEMITSIAMNEAKRAIRKQLSLPTFDEFMQFKKEGTDLSLKLVALPPAHEREPVTTADVEDSVAMTEARTMSMPVESKIVIAPAEEPVVAESVNLQERPTANTNEWETAIEPMADPASIPAMEETAALDVPIELFSTTPPADLGGTDAETEAA
jgi:hypothetical protein